MKNFSFRDIMSALTHIRGGIPVARLSTRIRLAEHKSVFFGPSYDLYDIQEYDPERDPANQIIQSLVGPDDEIFSRKCIEQHEVKVNFLVDLSSSIDAGMDFIKRRLLLEAIGYVGLTASRYQDPVGLVGFTDRIVLNLTPRCGVNNFYHLIRTTYDFLVENDPGNKKTPRRKTDFFFALDFVRKAFNKPCFIPVISDFVGFEKVVDSPLLRSVVSKHELIFIFLDDPLEFTSAKGIGYLRMENTEDGKQIVVSRRKLSELEVELRRKRRELRNKLRKMGVYSVVLEYGEQGRHFNRLHRFFLKRHKSLSIRT